MFDFPADLITSPETTHNVDAGRVNAFYITNELHDVWYLYGFNEESYNFQDDNFGKGGLGGDRVEVSVQAPGSNNAYVILASRIVVRTFLILPVPIASLVLHLSKTVMYSSRQLSTDPRDTVASLGECLCTYGP